MCLPPPPPPFASTIYPTPPPPSYNRRVYTYTCWSRPKLCVECEMSNTYIEKHDAQQMFHLIASGDHAINRRFVFISYFFFQMIWHTRKAQFLYIYTKIKEETLEGTFFFLDNETKTRGIYTLWWRVKRPHISRGIFFLLCMFLYRPVGTGW